MSETHASGAVRLAASAALPEGKVIAVKAPGFERIAIYRVNDGLYATQDACTHARASLAAGDLDGTRIACPVHGAEFCIKTGAALSFPAEKPLRVFKAWEAEGAIWADLTTARTSSV